MIWGFWWSLLMMETKFLKWDFESLLKLSNSKVFSSINFCDSLFTIIINYVRSWIQRYWYHCVKMFIFEFKIKTITWANIQIKYWLHTCVGVVRRSLERHQPIFQRAVYANHKSLKWGVLVWVTVWHRHTCDLCT